MITPITSIQSFLTTHINLFVNSAVVKLVETLSNLAEENMNFINALITLFLQQAGQCHCTLLGVPRGAQKKKTMQLLLKSIKQTRKQHFLQFCIL